MAAHGSSGLSGTSDVRILRRLVDAGQLTYRESLALSHGAVHREFVNGSWRADQLKEHVERHGRKFSGAGRGGSMNPEFVEWLMGWPIGWTDFEPLAMDKFRRWLRSLGAY